MNNQLRQGKVELKTIADTIFSQIIENVKEERPYVLGITGRVSIGKTTVAREIKKLAEESGLFDSVNLFSTDHFLLSDAQLEEQGVSEPRGFPQSYQGHMLEDFLKEIRRGNEFEHPVYSHTTYDVLPGEKEIFNPGELNIIEGINLFYDDEIRPSLEKYYDYVIYLDAPEEYTWSWYLNRVFYHISLCDDEDNFFYPFVEMDPKEIEKISLQYWNAMNQPNDHLYIAPTKKFADMVIHLGKEHEIERVVQKTRRRHG